MPGLLPIAALAAAVTAVVSPPPPAVAPSTVSGWQLDADADVQARWTSAVIGESTVGRPLLTDPGLLPEWTRHEARVRAGGELTWKRPRGLPSQVQLNVQADLVNAPLQSGGSVGPKHADPAILLKSDPIAAHSNAWDAPNSQLLRQFSVEFAARWGRLLAGRTVSEWGLGLLAQDGKADPFDFGVRRQGTVVDRVQAVLIPAAIPGDGLWAAVIPVAFAVAADHVVFDDLADASQGDDATNTIAAVIVKHLHFEGGLYGVQRSQVDRRGLRIDATVGDVFVRWHDRFGRWDVEAAAEALIIRGDTTYFRTAANPDKLKLEQDGRVLRLTAKRKWLAIRLQAGQASGDQNPTDDTVRNLKFAADYRVGLVLFHEYMRRSTAASAANISDARFTGQPPAGYERLASGGAVTQAMYINPVVRVGPFVGFTLQAGLLLAQAPVPLVDPYFSNLHSAPKGPGGGDATTDLGVEIDLGARYERKFGPLTARAQVDWGTLTPGTAFADPSGDAPAKMTVLMGQLMLSGGW